MTIEENEQVIEQLDSMKVEAPQGDYNLINPFAYLNPEQDQSQKALLILNQEINVDLELIWNHCQLRLCADAGANRLYNYFTSDEEREKYIPDYIVGDFDSIDDEVKSYYSKLGSVIIAQSDQYSNDFMKCIYAIQLNYQLLHQPWPNIDSRRGLQDLWESIESQHKMEVKVFVLNAIGGRFDQTIQSINQLYILQKSNPNLTISFITKNDIVFLLHKGDNYVTYPSKSVFNKSIQPTCGLLPLSDKPIVLNTWGLKYDVRNWYTRMTGQVSSSNRISGDHGFIVNASDNIVMNIEIDP